MHQIYFREDYSFIGINSMDFPQLKPANYLMKAYFNLIRAHQVLTHKPVSGQR